MVEGWAGKPAEAMRARARASLLAVLLVACCTGPLARAASAVPDLARAPQYFPPLERPPLDPPLRLSATFGEYRIGHFHAGLDFSTGEQVGRPIYASLAGYVMRVRASGVGYGRSIYLQADDGRLLVYGHLDAIDEPLASYVEGVQVAAGQYEQDLWPDSTRFRVQVGQRLGWSGRSGTDSPHLHFEIRRGDVAYNPLLAGVSVVDTVAPVIRTVTLDPLEDDSAVDGDVVPVTKVTGAAADTFGLLNQARLLVEAVDARADGRRTMVPWRIRVDDGERWIECRFDSVSWAEGMGEVDWVYDRGLRAHTSSSSVLMWAPEGFRASVQSSGVGDAHEAGTLELGGQGMGRLEPRPRTVRVAAEDVAGNSDSCRLVLWPETAQRDSANGSVSWGRLDSTRFAALDPSWGRNLGARERGNALVWPRKFEPGWHSLRDFKWYLRGSAFFEARPVIGAVILPPRSAGELKAASEELSFHPVRQPVRSSFPIFVSLRSRPDRRLGLYRDSGGGWEWLGANYDAAARTLGAETRSFGRFALFRDVEAPRIETREPPGVAPAGPYSTWALEARIEENGSGVVARESYFVVDGRRVPSEWDAVAETLRWRPLHAPASGTHKFEVVAADRAGNRRRRHGSFVLD